MEEVMRVERASLVVITLLSASLAHGQVSIDVSKVTCDQFAQGKMDGSINELFSA
jgi:hypothetical protein